MNRRRVLRAVSAAMLVCSLLFYEQSARSQMVATASSGDFIIFDPTGSTFTVPSGITPSGVITGYYTDANGVNARLLAEKAHPAVPG